MVSLADGDRVGDRYRLRKRLATGPMATVWEADDLELGRRVAIKFVGPAGDAARLRREAQAGATLDHPNICRVFDVGELSGSPYLVTEFLPGGTLEQRLRPGERLPDDETRSLAVQLASALAHAHAIGVIHRDLKPTNVLLDADGAPRLADFGIASLRGAERLTEDGTVLGTAAYMAPEQAGGEVATPRSDVYAFGAILYRLLTGRPPFGDARGLAALSAARKDGAPVVAELRPDAPGDLAALAESALAFESSARPADGQALADALTPRSTALPARDAETLVAARHRHARLKAAIITATVLALATTGFVLAGIAERGSATDEPVPPPRSQPRRHQPASVPLEVTAPGAAERTDHTRTGPTDTTESTPASATATPPTPSPATPQAPRVRETEPPAASEPAPPPASEPPAASTPTTTETMTPPTETVPPAPGEPAPPPPP